MITNETIMQALMVITRKITYIMNALTRITCVGKIILFPINAYNLKLPLQIRINVNKKIYRNKRYKNWQVLKV